MNPGEGKGEVSLSNEFFKKLNQQIVQKDNLIKLLQLQIKNLKSQVTDPGAQDQQKSELAKALEAKEAEIQNLSSELAREKAQLSAILSEKEEQIQALNKALEEHQGALEKGAGVSQQDERLEELQTTLQKVEEELEAEKNRVALLESQNAEFSAKNSEEVNKLLNELEMSRAVVARAQELQDKNAILASELEKANQEIFNSNKKIEEFAQQPISNQATSRESELEQDILTLKSLLREKDEQISAIEAQPQQLQAGPSEEEQLLRSEVEALRIRIAEWSPKVTHYDELKKLLVKLEEDSKEVTELREKVASISTGSENIAKVSMKLATLETQHRELKKAFEKQSSELISSQNQSEKLRQELSSMSSTLEQTEGELEKARSSLETQLDQSVNTVATKAEFDRLTNQMADQLLAIKNFEDRFRELQDQISAKDSEISSLRQKVSFPSTPTNPRVVKISSDSQVIADFLDFFDGLDNFLAKNMIPELQTLHQKLLDRLIIPNQIQYVPVISEEFDPTFHLATDFFLSTEFPEKCIVFEVEKGYRREETVIKKSKVWVIQNLFNCHKCDTPQSIPDSRFCYKCGQQILAPNGLPVEKLPAFEPTVITYLKFAERMIEKELLDNAKDYLLKGLSLDPNYVPALLRLADVYALSFLFPEAIEVLKRASALKSDPHIIEKAHALEIKNTIFQQARTLPPDEFEKLIINLRHR